MLVCSKNDVYISVFDPPIVQDNQTSQLKEDTQAPNNNQETSTYIESPKKINMVMKPATPRPKRERKLPAKLRDCVT